MQVLVATDAGCGGRRLVVAAPTSTTDRPGVLPWDVAPPVVGDAVPVRMRLTTMYADEIVVS